MTDIVERLRERAFACATAMQDKSAVALKEAADEIEKLRAVLRETAKPWTGVAADLLQAAEMVIAELERRRAVAEAALGGGDE